MQQFHLSSLSPEVNNEDIQFGDVIGRGTFATVHKGDVNGAVVPLKCFHIPAGSDMQQVVTM